MTTPSTPWEQTPTSALFNSNMYSTPRRSYGRKASTPASTASAKGRLKGTFKDNGWWCDCEPRLPAVRYQVKKNNANRNKWFYTCQQDRKKQCGFFLWEDDAQVREKGALLNNTATDSKITTHIGPGDPPTPSLVQSSRKAAEMGPASSIGTIVDDGSEISTGDELDMLDMASLADNASQTRRRLFQSSSTPRPQRADSGQPQQQAAKPAKRKRGDSMFVDDSNDDDDLFGDGLSSDEERTMATLADSASQRPPQKDSQAQQDQFKTPSAQRTYDASVNGLPTPVSRHTIGRNTLLTVQEEGEREAKRQKMGEMGAPPTPSVNRIALSVPQTPSVSSGQLDRDDYDITQEVIGLLSGTPMIDSVRNGVRRALNRYALKMKGVERGRDVVRLSVKQKDLKIAQLEEQVAMQESEKRADKERIDELVRSVDHTALRGIKDEFGYNHPE